MIRKYEPEDLGQVIDIWFDASQVAHPFLDPKFFVQERDMIREVHLRKALTWVYSGDDGLEGFISMLGNEVGAIFVRPEKHGQGIGKLLMDHVSSFHDELEVEVFQENHIGRSFYAKYGFVTTNEKLHEATNQMILRMRFSKKSSKN